MFAVGSFTVDLACFIPLISDNDANNYQLTLYAKCVHIITERIIMRYLQK